MAVRMLQPGAKVADAAFPNANFPAQMAAEGIEAFCGYLSSPTDNGKNWDAERLEWFKTAGCGLFCEQYETIVLEGYSANNLKLGRQCQVMADALGAPDDAPLWFAVDTSPFGHFDAIAASFQAYKDTNRRPIYAYCGSQCGEFLMDEGLIEGFHVPSAVSWSATSDSLNGTTVFAYNNGRNRWYLSPLANMLQHNSVDFAGSRIDPNEVLRPTPFWFPGETPPHPQPPLQGDFFVGTHIAWVDVVDDATQSQTLYFGELIMRIDGVLARTDAANDAPGVYGLPLGKTTQSAYEALPVWDPIWDAYWMADRFKERGVGVGNGAAPKAVRIQSVPGDATVVY